MDGVDGLRALAIVYVLFNHIGLQLIFAHVPFCRHLPAALVSALIWQGQRGVQIFFAVSGFLITSTSLRRWASPTAFRIRDFYLIRFARIAPLFLTLLAVLSILHLAHVQHFVIPERDGGLRSALVAALTFRVGLLEATRGYLPGNWDILWSLSVEETFYLFFPLAYRFLGRGRKMAALLGFLIALGPFARTVFTHGNEVWREYSYLGGMDAIAVGCLTAIILSHHQPSRNAVRAFLIGGLVLLAFCVTFDPAVAKLEKFGIDMTLVAIGTCMIIAAAATRWHAPRPVYFLLAYGRRSYEIYLTHMFVVLACFGIFADRGKPLGLVLPLFLVTIALAGFLGELIARYFSEPANGWLRRRFGDAPSTLGSVIEEPVGMDPTPVAN